MIYAKENRDVDTCSIPGAFIQTDTDEMICVQLKRTLTIILVQVDQNKYEIYIIYLKEMPAIYLIF